LCLECLPRFGEIFVVWVECAVHASMLLAGGVTP